MHKPRTDVPRPTFDSWQSREDIPGSIGNLCRPSLAKLHDVVDAHRDLPSLDDAIAAGAALGLFVLPKY